METRSIRFNFPLDKKELAKKKNTFNSPIPSRIYKDLISYKSYSRPLMGMGKGRGVGDLGTICEEYMKLDSSPTYDGFCSYFFKKGLDDVDDRYRGRTLDEIKENAKIYYSKFKEEYGSLVSRQIALYYSIQEKLQEPLLSEKKRVDWDVRRLSGLTIQDFFDNLILHSIIETFDGHYAEHKVGEWINRRLDGSGLKCRPATKDDDDMCGIDLYIEDCNGTKKYLIQVKPMSFIYRVRKKDSLGNPYPDILKDVGTLFTKEQRAYRKYGLNTSFIFYQTSPHDSSFRVLEDITSPGMIRFDPHELFSPDKQNPYIASPGIIDERYLVPLSTSPSPS